MSILTVSEQVTPATPSVGKKAVYYKADGLFYTLDSAGVETVLNASNLTAAMALKIDLTQKGTANGVATLDATSKIPAAQLPSVAITDTFPVVSQAAQVALTAQVGDVAIRSDQNLSYILMTEPASVFANWLVLASPTDSVTSVAGKVGVVTLVKGDVGLDNVDNTSDATKVTAYDARLAGGTLPISATTISASGNIAATGLGNLQTSNGIETLSGASTYQYNIASTTYFRTWNNAGALETSYNGGSPITTVSFTGLAVTGELSATGALTIGSYTLATRPAHAAGKIIYVSDGGAGGVFQGSNGSAWVNLG